MQTMRPSGVIVTIVLVNLSAPMLPSGVQLNRVVPLTLYGAKSTRPVLMGRVLGLLRGRAGRCVSIEDNVPALQSFSHDKRQQMDVTIVWAFMFATFTHELFRANFLVDAATGNTKYTECVYTRNRHLVLCALLSCKV